MKLFPHRWPLTCLVLVLILPVWPLSAEEPPPASEPQVQAELKKLAAHSWDTVETVVESKVPFGDRVYFFEPDGNLVELAFHAERHPFTIDPTTDPKRMTVRVTDNAQRTYDWPWIYKWEGDDLYISRAIGNKDAEGNIVFRGYPKDFSPAQGYYARMQPGPQPRLAEHAVLRDLPRNPGTLAYTPDGKSMVLSMGTGGFLVWDLEEEKAAQLVEFPDARFVDFSFSSDGALMAASMPALDGVVIYDTANWQVLEMLKMTGGWARFLSDGKSLITAGNYIQVWNTDDWSIRQDVGSQWQPDDVAITAGDKQVFTTSDDTDVLSVIDVASWKEVSTKKVPIENFSPLSIAYHANTNRLAMADKHGKYVVRVDLNAGNYIPPKLNHPNDAYQIAISPDGSQLAVGSSAQIVIWDWDTAKVIARYRQQQLFDAPIWDLEYSPDGKWLAATIGGYAFLWKTEGEAPTQTNIWPVLEPSEQRLIDAAADADRLSETVAYLDLKDMPDSPRHRVVTDPDGKPLYSWRVEAFAPTFQAERRIQKEKSWDSPENKELFAKLGSWLELPGDAPGTTCWQLVTGPTTGYLAEGSPPEVIKPLEKLRAVQTAPDRAVPVASPQDFVYDPSDPWAGLPPGGFFAVTYGNQIVFIPGDTPAETLKQLFDVSSPAEGLDIEEISGGVLEASLRKRLNVPVTPRTENFPVYGSKFPLLSKPE